MAKTPEQERVQQAKRSLKFVADVLKRIEKEQPDNTRLIREADIGVTRAKLELNAAEAALKESQRK